MKGILCIKRMVSAWAVLILCIAGLGGQAWAFPVKGRVSPLFTAPGSGTATYRFSDLPSSPAFLGLLFDREVFGDISLVGGSVSRGSRSLGTEAVGQGLMLRLLDWGRPELTFQVDFSLLDDTYDWEQSFGGISFSNCRPRCFRGTTDLDPEAPIPEPGTMILLGISMLTLAAYGRKGLPRD